MASTKRLSPIAKDDVPRVFDDACIKQLADIARLPAGADEARFAASIREAALIYARDARAPTAGELRDEVKALYNAARHRQYDCVMSLLASPQVRDCLQKRLNRPGPQAAGWKLPPLAALLDSARRDEACEMIERLCRVGGSYVEGRMRPTDKRSTSWKPQLHVPVPDKHPPKREAELQFVMHLQLAWLEATGSKPTATVNPSRPDRPFANFMRECLQLVGAAHADPVALINELARRRRLFEGR